ncbi:MAG: flagellar biosynthesis protein FliQ [Xylanivirga thermophila]|jgi:flagellar biosynthesis protein FliQ|uniref:flagellar biosynthesis protein FliQ n=1 Tax=Xylanivirga thermophila TaxID=2496273 RepID=UPI00101DBEB0|nr:flagellar biosynthesis protein FliQ [Xylanivirga thermophila]
MTQRDVIGIAQQAIYTGITIAAPMLILGLVMGLLVAIFQATTQINEQTMVFIPKILAIVLAIYIFGPWMLRTMTEYTLKLYDSINSFIGL